MHGCTERVLWCRDEYRGAGMCAGMNTGVQRSIQYKGVGACSTGVHGCTYYRCAEVYRVHVCRGICSTGVQGCIQYRRTGVYRVLVCRGVYTVHE